MRLLAGDLPIIQQALAVYVRVISTPDAPLQPGTPQFQAYWDAVELAQRMLARATNELNTAATPSGPVTSPTPGVTL